MRGSYPDVNLQRNAILVASGLCMAVAIAMDPGILITLLTPWGLIAWVLKAAAGLALALAIREFAEVFLKTPDEPWYVRRGSLLFLGVLMIVTGTFFGLTEGTLRESTKAPQVEFTYARILTCWAMALLWVVFLEELDRIRPRSAPPHEPGPERKPRFRPFREDRWE
jgi:hypothetical protein